MTSRSPFKSSDSRQFGCFGLLILYGVLSLWLESSRLVIEGGEARVKGGILGLGGTQRLAVEEIKSVESKISMQHGSGSGTPYYEIRLIPQSGRPVVVGRYIKNKRELDWLLEEIREAMASASVAVATSRAALLESPPPRGTFDSTTSSSGPTSSFRCPHNARTPRT